MNRYRCAVCGGVCDPGELNGGICFECRTEETEREERRAGEFARILGAVKEQMDGQMALEV